jgi:hypothetical protein
MGRIPKQEKELNSLLKEVGNNNSGDQEDEEAPHSNDEEDSLTDKNNSNGSLMPLSANNKLATTNSSVLNNNIKPKYLYALNFADYDSFLKTKYKNTNEINHVFADLLRMRSHEIFAEFMTHFEPQAERNTLYLTSESFPKEHVLVKDVFQGIAHDIAVQIKQLYVYARKMPGFASLTRQDLNTLIKHNFFPVYLIATSSFYQNKKFYYT